ncbi:MAG: hypothetical protein O9345_08515 [Burkholderiaceae bacterium]|nr:hypothetical protein [Burkholderiales bacterium]MCZ8104816.1 hypothetical protein [Burkholderiales bacterium]MCZ8338183.1 hypothetical protein [Burkholderiaceae bacterium]
MFLLPNATDDALGAGRWGAGPTGVVLRQSDGWTWGAPGNDLWSVGGGLRYRAESPEGGPQGWGLRLSVTLLCPR